MLRAREIAVVMKEKAVQGFAIEGVLRSAGPPARTVSPAGRRVGCRDRDWTGGLEAVKADGDKRKPRGVYPLLMGDGAESRPSSASDMNAS